MPGGRSVITALGDFQYPNICSRDAPASIGKWLGVLKDVDNTRPMQDAFGFRKTADGDVTVPDWAWWIFGFTSVTRNGKKYIEGYKFYHAWILGVCQFPLWLGDTFSNFFIPVQCPRVKFIPLYITKFFTKLLKRWTGFESEVTERIENAVHNYLCPNKTIPVQEAIAQYIHGNYTEQEVKGFAALEGYCDYVVDAMIDNDKHRPTNQQIVDMYFRDIITSKEGVYTQLRANGVLQANAQRNILEASYTKIDLGHICRALHQCRKGLVDPKLEYNDQDARRDIKALGYEDEWIERLLYLCKADISHRELKRVYYTGQIGEKELRDYIKKDGFNADDETALVALYNLEKTEYQWRIAGGPSASEVTSALAKGELGTNVFMSELKLQGLTPDQIAVSKKVAYAKRQQDMRSRAIEGVRAGLRSGELDQDTAIGSLLAQDIDAVTASSVVSGWTEEFEFARKPASPQQLCDWWTRGLLSTAEYRQRLQRLGWGSNDVRRVLAVCDANERKKIETAAAAEQRRIEAQNAKAAKEVAMAGQIRDKKTLAERKAIAVANLRAANEARKKAREDLALANRIGAEVATREKAASAGTLAAEPGPTLEEISLPDESGASVTSP